MQFSFVIVIVCTMIGFRKKDKKKWNAKGVVKFCDSDQNWVWGKKSDQFDCWFYMPFYIQFCCCCIGKVLKQSKFENLYFKLLINLNAF